MKTTAKTAPWGVLLTAKLHQSTQMFRAPHHNHRPSTIWDAHSPMPRLPLRASTGTVNGNSIPVRLTKRMPKDLPCLLTSYLSLLGIGGRTPSSYSA
jgi:hypothetical protein